MDADSIKLISLSDELETSHNLLVAGFGALQEIDMGNTFYHLPHQLMASGFERVMKCYISLVHRGRTGAYPDQNAMKALGHDLTSLLDEICTSHFGGTSRPFVRSDHEFIRTDHVARECIRILSLFGRFGRYYNLDIVAGSGKNPVDPAAEWKELETEAVDPIPYSSSTEKMQRDYYPRVNAYLIAKMERVVRAIAMQFTIGDHQDPDGLLGKLAHWYANFRNLNDSELGETDYRRSVHILRQADDRWVERSDQEILASGWPTRVVTREEASFEWPFRCERVIVECRRTFFAIVNVGGFMFALNGAARSHLKVPDPHEAGVAILGKSIGPFIEMALKIGSPG